MRLFQVTDYSCFLLSLRSSSRLHRHVWKHPSVSPHLD